ncbi:MAG TPA: citrate/2-methylcitrate synthase [Candidatus Paceibacterota bacterium]
MKFKTKKIKQDPALIGKVSFAQAILSMLTGRECDVGELEFFEVLLVAGMDNGIEAPSVFVPRVVASTGNSINTALAAGVLAIGDYHGGAIEACVNYLNSGKDASAIVGEVLAKNERMPGYGHKIYKDADPRVTAIYQVAEKVGKMGKFMKLAREIEKELASQSGKKLPLNIDGAIAGVMCELGLDARYGKAIFALSRLPNMARHVIEELDNDKPYRRLEESDVTRDSIEK